MELRGKPIDIDQYASWHPGTGMILCSADGSRSHYCINSQAFLRSEGDWYAIGATDYDAFRALLDELDPEILTEY